MFIILLIKSFNSKDNSYKALGFKKPKVKSK
jgi:hypothetical protein